MKDGKMDGGKMDGEFEHIEYDDGGAAKMEWAAIGIGLCGLAAVISSMIFGVPLGA